MAIVSRPKSVTGNGLMLLAVATTFYAATSRCVESVGQEPPVRPRTVQGREPSVDRSIPPQPPTRDRASQPAEVNAGGPGNENAPILAIDNGAFMGVVEAIDFSPDGKWVAAGGEYHVRVWEIESGRLVATLRGDRSKAGRGAVNAVRFSPDGRHLLVGVAEYSDTGSIRIYRTDQWKAVEGVLSTGNAGTKKIAFSQDGRYLVSSDSNGYLHAWDWPKRRRIGEKPKRREAATIFDVVEFIGQHPAVFCIELDGYFVYSVPQLHEADARTAPKEMVDWIGRAAGVTGQVEYPFAAEPPRVVTLRLDHGRWAAAGVKSGGESNPWAAVWETGKLSPKSVYRGHRWLPTSVALSHDARTAASGDKFGEVHLWEADTGKLIRKFTGAGEALYAGFFSGDRTKIGYSNQPDLANWGFNRYGRPTKAFDLNRRSISEIDSEADISWNIPVQSNRESTLRREFDARRGVYRIHRDHPSHRAYHYELPTGIMPTVYSLIDRPVLGVNHPVIIGHKEGGLMVWDSESDELRRYFSGHLDMVTATSLAEDRKLLLSSSTDRTLRIWSLADTVRPGIPDFKYEDSRVKRVASGTAAAKAGIKVGDRIRTIDGFNVTQLYDAMLEGQFARRPGDLVDVEMIDGMRYRLPLVAGFDIVEPTLSIFLADDDSWIIWDARGYYDCSPGADRLIGWHVNRGADRESDFYRVQQFQEKFYRPDIINDVIAGNDRIPQTAKHRPGDTSPPAELRAKLDLRNRITLDAIGPATVWVRSPENGVTLSDRRVDLELEIVRFSEAPVTELYFLVNGNRADHFRLTPEESKQQQVRVTKRLTLGPGRNRVSVIAQNSQGIRTDPENCRVEVHVPAAAGPVAAHALVIGVGQYQFDGRGVNNLAYPAKDAAAFCELLKKHGSGGLYSEVETKILTDETATRERIIEGLDWLTDRAAEGDTVFLFIAGHGAVDSRDQFYLIAHDTDPDRKSATGILFEQEIINRFVKQLPNCRRVIFLDACHSGSPSTPSAGQSLVRLSSPHLGLFIFASSDSKEKSFELDNWGHGAFTLSLIESVTDESTDLNQNALLDTDELKVAISRRVKQMTHYRQTPRVIVPFEEDEAEIVELLNH